MWLTVFYNGFWHVVPADEEGEVLKPHIPHPECPCCPEMEYEEIDDDDEEMDTTRTILVHNQLH